MSSKFIILLRDELSFSSVRSVLVQGLVHYALLLFCFSVLIKSDGSLASQIQAFSLTVVFNFILLSMIIPSYFEGDFADGYINWLKARDETLHAYFLAKIVGGIPLFIIPIVLLSLGCLFSMDLEGALNSLCPFVLHSTLSLFTALCWGCLFQLVVGGTNLAQNCSLGTSLLSLLLIPIMVPTILVGWEFINALVQGNYWGYYLGMQGGLLIASLAMGLGLAPVIIKHTEIN